MNMFCPSCGFRASESQRYCPHCGNDLYLERSVFEESIPSVSPRALERKKRNRIETFLLVLMAAIALFGLIYAGFITYKHFFPHEPVISTANLYSSTGDLLV